MNPSMPQNTALKSNPLGKKTKYSTQYSPDCLFSIPRKEKREEIGLSENIAFHGVDIWNAYELSWLNQKGKPEVAVAEFRLNCDSPYLLESKSLKLYFFSLNQTKFESPDALLQTITKDLSQASKSPVFVELKLLKDLSEHRLEEPLGTCIDDLDIEAYEYTVNPKLLKSEKERASEKVYSNLLRSNCPITEQPDWATVYIKYEGNKINHSSLLKYIISFRNHSAFHEHCIERIFVDLLKECKLNKLTVYGKFTRRGGLDINPFRSNFEDAPSHFIKSFRQ